MPTRRPRHTVTETPPVERALRRLRTLQPGAIDFKELVILGAHEKATRLERGDDGTDRSPRIEHFLALRASERLDAGAGLALHESGWTRTW